MFLHNTVSRRWLQLVLVRGFFNSMCIKTEMESDIKNRFVLPPNLILKNFDELNLGKLDKTYDSGLASYYAGQADRSLSWMDVKWLKTKTRYLFLATFDLFNLF
ncbi:hypothetical protein L1987_13100 [Smallanthus sonchifolius]|uniref:Uncharacterized protein n=1 Tax=Smallanthus sonchifolius TaxID=185202 RepID=A0ACB9JGG3_9ASTR|nr:hypothetical protein L1987_13100 [Smallanthus sonchifolius]